MIGSQRSSASTVHDLPESSRSDSSPGHDYTDADEKSLNHKKSLPDEESFQEGLNGWDGTSTKAEESGVVDPMHPSQFPDGGVKAWLCVAGAFAGLFCSFGWINCVGVFQDYYAQERLSQYDPSTIGWISSTEVFFMLFCSPLVGLWFDNFGPRWLLIVGTLMHVFGLMMTSLSQEYYQFFLSQSVCSAIGASMIFSPSVSCLSTWFLKKRGLAIGLCAAGSSLGGVLFPIIVSRMIPETGFPWAMRTCAFLILALMIFANFTVTSRLPPLKRKFEAMAFVRPLCELPFVLVTLATFFFYWGMFVPFSFIVADATGRGMSLELANYLVSMLNAASIFGRTLPGILGDKYGRYNVMIIFATFTSILILALWLPAHANATFIVFSPLFGFASGAAIGLMPVLVAQISPVKDIGTRTGTVFGIASFAALTGTPIGGALVNDEHNKFTHAKIFSGVLCAVGSLFYVAARASLAGFALKKKV